MGARGCLERTDAAHSRDAAAAAPCKIARAHADQAA
jgi:hypothetical protein